MSTLFTALAMIAAGQINGGTMGPAPARAVAQSRETSVDDAPSDGMVDAQGWRRQISSMTRSAPASGEPQG